LLALADWQFVNGIRSQVVGFVVVAGRPFGFHIIDVLPVGRRCRRTTRTRPSSVVAGVVGHALCECEGPLVLQSMAFRLLKHSLQAVVRHTAIRLRARYGADFAQQLWSLAVRKERAR